MRRNVIFFCICKMAGVVLCKKQGCSIKLCSTAWCNWCLSRNGFENVGVARVTSKDAVLFPKHSLRYMRCCCCLHSNSAAECVPLLFIITFKLYQMTGPSDAGVGQRFFRWVSPFCSNSVARAQLLHSRIPINFPRLDCRVPKLQLKSSVILFF